MDRDWYRHSALLTLLSGGLSLTSWGVDQPFFSGVFAGLAGCVVGTVLWVWRGER